MANPPTVRELDALRAVCKPGGSMASAAYELGVSPHAVHKRLLRIYARLEVNSAAQAAYALRKTL
jgi:DNA-binding NarL/FixJ family response regulator